VSNRLTEIRARLHAATPGPWLDAEHYVWGGDPRFMVVEHAPCRTDARFISHAPTDIAWLLDEVEEARKATAVAIRQRDDASATHRRHIALLSRYAHHASDCWVFGDCVCGLASLVSGGPEVDRKQEGDDA